MLPLAVASYNVLADAYVRPERYAGVPLVALDFMSREPLLLRRVAGLGADVVCLQEVEHALYPTLEDYLRPQGYVGHYARKGNNKPDGCATFVRGAVQDRSHANPQLCRRQHSAEVFADRLRGAASLS